MKSRNVFSKRQRRKQQREIRSSHPGKSEASPPRVLPRFDRFIAPDCEFPSNRDWFAVMTHPMMDTPSNLNAGSDGPENWSSKAQRKLEAAGFVVFAPLVRRSVRCRQITRETVRPVFPGYLFVCPKGASWAPLSEVDYVVGPIMANGKPARISPAVMAALIDRQHSLASRSTPAPSLRPGQPVCVRLGQFSDLFGTVSRDISDDEVEVLVTIFGAARPITVRRGELAALDKAG